MNTIETIVNAAFTAVGKRPASWLAAATLPVTSLLVSHQGFERALPTGIVDSVTAAMIGLEFAQWISLGRLSQIQDAGDDARETTLRAQMLGIGALQVVGYTIAIVGHAAAQGQDWSRWPALAVVAMFGAFFAWLNVSMKWTIADPIETKRRRAGSAETAVFGAAPKALAAPAAGDDEPPPATEMDLSNVHFLTRKQREVAGYSAERRELAQIFAEERAAGQREEEAERANALALRGVRNGKGGKFESLKQPAQKRRRKAA